ncbi:site-specific integrase [Phyllobacterium myrsinacearum]|uniref:site-specific integrase n=1 Tax=Phyllobacterium myrsinacearum TaxID=28101 RepID=UPI000D9B018B|nr:site-specific integrase [Phyllobacterium myrsinacearum]PWV94125.1 hypothetical protein DEV92_103302 [Phyllobacterium myrsinacearum]RZV07436.1 hypothetical protein EV654_2106 [Phyllobacterium myrsinacearum]
MSETLHLQKRGEVWHYYRRVPKHLVDALGRTFIKRSLGVTSRADAKRLRAIEDVKTDALFASLEETQNSPSKAGSSKLQDISLHMLTEHVRLTVQKLDKRSAAQFLMDPPEDSDDLYERKQNAKIELGILTSYGDPTRDGWVSDATHQLLKEAGASNVASETYWDFAEIVRRGLVEVQRKKIDRYDDRHDRLFYDHLFNPSRSSSISFSELAQIFITEREAEYHLNGVSQKRFDKVKAIVETLQEIIGSEKMVATIDDDLVQHVRGMLAKLPTNRNKRFPGLPLEDAILRSQSNGGSILSPLSQSNYLDVFRDMLKVALRKKLLSNNPAAEARPLKKDNVASDQKRLPWTHHQLKGFFEGKFYHRCVPSALKPYTKADREWRFWLPLIMLFSGARPNEVAQLHFSDLKQTDKGTWYLDLAEGGGEDAKSLKTESSRRRVPVHSELLKIGLVEFVKTRNDAASKNGQRLFWGLIPNKYGNCAWYAARRLNEHFIPEEIELGQRQSLYSLRHNVRDALRRIKAPSETLLAIAGWSPSGKAISDDYGDPGNPDLHVEWVNGIAYEGLDLMFLHQSKNLE